MKRKLKIIVSVPLFIGAVAFSQEQPANKPTTNDSAASVEQGRKIFTQKCAVCHQADSNTKLVGPGLKGLSGRKFVTTDAPVTDEALRKWTLKGDGRMPPFEKVLDDRQVDNLVLYLKTL